MVGCDTHVVEVIQKDCDKKPDTHVLEVIIIAVFLLFRACSGSNPGLDSFQVELEVNHVAGGRSLRIPIRPSNDPLHIAGHRGRSTRDIDGARGYCVETHRLLDRT